MKTRGLLCLLDLETGKSENMAPASAQYLAFLLLYNMAEGKTEQDSQGKVTFIIQPLPQ
jgi:hypothetical protein